VPAAPIVFDGINNKSEHSISEISKSGSVVGTNTSFLCAMSALAELEWCNQNQQNLGAPSFGIGSN
jgi:hypothetical protein